MNVSFVTEAAVMWRPSSLQNLLYGSEIWALNNVIKIGFELQKWNIYGEQQGTLFFTTKETKKFYKNSMPHL
jgi:hypothetical protein